MIESAFISNNYSFFNRELIRRKYWIKNKRDVEANKEWSLLSQKIKKKKKFSKVFLAYNFSKNLIYYHPGLSSEVYFDHPLRVCLLSTKLKKENLPELMTLCLLHNVFETSNISEEIIKKLFGTKTCKFLKILTVNRKKENKKGYKKSYYKKIEKSHHYLPIVKILDKLDNLYLLKNNKNNKVKKNYIKEIETYLMPLVRKKANNIYAHFEELIQFSK